MATVEPRISVPGQLVRAAVVIGVLLLLGANLPGHMSYDSVASLREGRLGVRETWGPALYAWILGQFDKITPGTGLYVATSVAVFGGCLLLLRTLRPRTSWVAAPVAAAVMASPQVFIYQAIVWKDVMFANCAVAGFALLAYAASRWEARGPRLAALAAVTLFFTAGALVRQNGVILLPFAALALGWAARGEGWRRACAWGLGGLVVTLVLIKAVGVIVEPSADGEDRAMRRGVRILEHYDIIGATAQEPGIRLDELAAAGPQYPALVRAAAARGYSPQRVEAIEVVPRISDLWLLPDPVVARQWRSIVLHHPRAYLEHRLDAFQWVAAPPDLGRCLPVFVGITATPELMSSLGLEAGNPGRDVALQAYAARFFATPFYAHITYGLLAFGVMVALLLRRDPADMAVAAMMASALAFAASFLVISIACDYRYLYFLDLAALVGVFYLALDPPLRRRQRASSASRAA